IAHAHRGGLVRGRASDDGQRDEATEDHTGPRESKLHVPSLLTFVPADRRSIRLQRHCAHFPILFLIGGIVLRYCAIASRSAFVRSLYPASVPSMTSPMRLPATSPSGLLPVPR